MAVLQFRNDLSVTAPDKRIADQGSGGEKCERAQQRACCQFVNFSFKDDTAVLLEAVGPYDKVATSVWSSSVMNMTPLIDRGVWRSGRRRETFTQRSSRV